jgi:hypothetical protein
MHLRDLRFAAILALLLASGLALADATDDDLAWKLCDGTMAALQGTDAAPLAAQFSPQASSLLIAQGDAALHLSGPRLLKMDKWADEPLFTAEAKPKPMMSVDADEGIAHLIAIVKDGEKNYWLDGMTVRKGDERKWLMLAILPKTKVSSDEELDGFKATLAPFFKAWQACDTASVLGVLAHDDVAVRMLGAAGRLQVFVTPSEVEAALKGVKEAGGVIFSGAELTEGVLSASVATVTMACKTAVGTMKPESETLLIHLYLDDGHWKIAGLWAQ